MMNFGDYLDGGAPYSMPFGHQPSKTIFKTPALSLALQMDMEGQTNNIEGQGAAENHASTSAFNNDDNNGNNVVGERRTRNAEEVAGTSNNNNNRSRSESDNMDADSGDDDQLDASPARKKRYLRHTPQQIQELEALFKECPHPDENQRLELSRRLNLETRQIKFWFQNRRTQMKSQVERQENSLLRQDNDRLRSDILQIREATRNPICVNCGGPAIMAEPSLEEQRLRIENAQLREELERVSAMASRFIGSPLPPPPMPNAGLELEVGENIDNGIGGLDIEFGLAISSPVPSNTPSRTSISVTDSSDRSSERSMWLELALSAMDELVRMAHYDEPLWVKSLESGKEVLNHEEYQRTFPPCVGVKPNGFVTEASRESGMVIINSVALVETLMDPFKWADMFPCVIARALTTEVISNGMEGTRNGALHLMHAELQVLSPLVPVRDVNFLRFCKQHAEGVWAVVDVAIDTIAGETSRGPSCRRLPSGCVVQDMPNGYSKVTWVEHAQYDESAVHPLYRPLVNSGVGFGAQRWVATLQRESECLATLLSSNTPSADHPAISAGGRRSMLKLAQRMTSNFCAGVCASTYDWNNLTADNVHEGVCFMTRKSVDHGEPSGTVLSATTSVLLPVSPQKLFNFLCDEQLRSEWDILSDGDPMQEMAHIAKGQDHGNCVSLLGSSGMNGNQSSMLILQETCIDATGLHVVYAPVHIPAMHAVLNGGDSAYVVMLPSGFAIAPDGWGLNGLSNNGPTTNGEASNRVTESLLTVNFQILVDSPPTANLTAESMETVNNLISCTIHKIKGALHLEG